MTIEFRQDVPKQNAREVCQTMGLDRVNQPGPEDPVFFYPKEFAVFDNFGSFQVEYDGYLWPTAEHAYQASRFKGVAPEVVEEIKKPDQHTMLKKLPVQINPNKLKIGLNL